jgi:uncharacterized membrane protein
MDMTARRRPDPASTALLADHRSPTVSRPRFIIILYVFAFLALVVAAFLAVPARATDPVGVSAPGGVERVFVPTPER